MINGRNEDASKQIFDLLRKVGLDPIEFGQARSVTEKGSPYIGEILDAAFVHAQAIVVLFMDDEEVRLRDELQGKMIPI